MRVVFATLEYVTEKNFDGGLANYIHRVALSLRKIGHEPIVVVASDRDETFIHAGIEIHRVDVRKTFLVNALILSTLFSMSLPIYFYRVGKLLNKRIELIHKKKPLDIIQYSHLGGVSLFININVPSIIRLSSYTPLARQQGGYDSSWSFQTRQQEFLEKLTLQRADAVFGPSKIIAAVVEKETGSTVEVIESPFILDTTEVDATILREHLDNKKYFLFFGALSVLKGMVTIADMLYDLLDRHPDLHFVFVGKETAKYRGGTMMDYVRAQAREHSSRVVFLGQLRHDQLYPVIAHATAVVLPSRIDNFPNTCLEAMAHRRVVVGTHGTSFEQLLRDGESGFLTTIGDPVNLLATIEKVLDLSEEQRDAIGAEAYKRIEELRPELVVEQLVRFYERCLQAKIAKSS